MIIILFVWLIDHHHHHQVVLWCSAVVLCCALYSDILHFLKLEFPSGQFIYKSQVDICVNKKLDKYL